MTRSRSLRRRANQQNLTRGFRRARPASGAYNWMVGSSLVDNTGHVVVGGCPQWGPFNAGAAPYTFVSGVPQSFQAVVIPQGVTVANPNIGRVRVDEIRGKIAVASAVSAGFYQFACCIYVSEFTLNTSAWDVVDPGDSSAAANDDFFYQEAAVRQLVPTTAPPVATSGDMTLFDLHISEPIIIGGGQAVHVSLGFTGAGNVTFLVAFKSRVTAIA